MRHAAPGSHCVALSNFTESVGLDTEETIHGGLISLSTNDALSSGVDIDPLTTGIGKLVFVINAGSDIAGTLTVTGTSVDRNTGVQTASDTDDIVIDALTTDDSGTDNGNPVHAFTGAYITSKWFVGTVVVSTTDLNLSDVDSWGCSFEQLNDAPRYVITTLDASFVGAVGASTFDAYLYALDVTGSKLNLTRDGTINSGATVSGLPYRLRHGNIGKAMNGANDGFFVETFAGHNNRIVSLTLKVWCKVIGGGTDVVTLALKGADTPSSTTDHAFARWDGTDGANLQDSNSTLSDAGVATFDDGSGNTVVITPDNNTPTLAMLGDQALKYTPAINILELATPGVTVGFPNDAAGAPFFVQERTAAPTTAFNHDIYLDNGTLTASGLPAFRRYTGAAWEDIGVNAVERQATFSYVTPVASEEFLLDGIPIGATITGCYAIVKAATSIVFSILMRARSAPFSDDATVSTIVNAQTATTTGGAKTVASSTYIADHVLKLTTGTVTGTPGELMVFLVYTVNA